MKALLTLKPTKTINYDIFSVRRYRRNIFQWEEKNTEHTKTTNGDYYFHFLFSISTDGRWTEKSFPAIQIIKCPSKSDSLNFVEKKEIKISSKLDLFCCCWLAAWRWPYRGSPWRLNHFVVITLYQQQHNSYFNLKRDTFYTTSSLTPILIPPCKLDHFKNKILI